MTKPLVSIVTPSYNQAAYLEETIVSVLEQDYPNLEYLVVDGGSTDGSVEIIRRYGDRLAWWTSGPDGGQASALNTGFARATGAFLGWLNADDTLLPGAVASMVEEFERDPELLLVYGDALYTDERSERTGYLPSRPWDLPRMVRACENHVVQPSSLWRRTAWEVAGPLDETGYYFFDFQFFLRLGAAGRAKRLERPLSTYRIHAASKTMDVPLAKADDFVRFADEFLATAALPDVLRPYAAEGRASAYLSAGRYYYAALDLPHARALFRRAARAFPRVLVRPFPLSLVVRSHLPEPAVRALRSMAERRRRRGADRD